MSDEQLNVGLLKQAYNTWNDTKGGSVDEWMKICSDNIKFGSLAQGPEGASYLTAYSHRDALNQSPRHEVASCCLLLRTAALRRDRKFRRRFARAISRTWHTHPRLNGAPIDGLGLFNTGLRAFVDTAGLFKAQRN